MKYLLTIALLTVLQFAHAQRKIINKKDMERFNISQFKAMAKDDEYVRTLSDGTTIDQMEINDGFVEKTTPPNSLFYEYKEFYPDGHLRSKGHHFSHGDYQAGLWIECGEDGTVTSQIDYDKQYKLDVRDVLRILQQKQIPFNLKMSSSQITRDVEDGKAIWYVRYVATPGRIDTLKVNDATGQIFGQGSIRHMSRR